MSSGCCPHLPPNPTGSPIREPSACLHRWRSRPSGTRSVSKVPPAGLAFARPSPSTTGIVTRPVRFSRLVVPSPLQAIHCGVAVRRDRRVPRRWLTLLSLIGLLVVLAAACTSADEPEESEEAALPEGTPAAETEGAAAGGAEGGTLQTVQERGTLNCGVND